jgi:hypothetical protein
MAATEIDWSTAQVSDAELVVALAPSPPPQWRARAKGAIALLERPGQSWDAIKVRKDRIVVSGVAEGSEGDVRHFLESVVLQANAGERDEAEEHVDEADERMTSAFQSFAGSNQRP